MNKGNIQDTEMENIMDATVDGLFSVFATLGNKFCIKVRSYVTRK